MIYMGLAGLFEEAGDFANAGLAYGQARDALRAAGDSTAAREAEAALYRLKGRGAEQDAARPPRQPEPRSPSS
jgi:hypothetical protein